VWSTQSSFQWVWGLFPRGQSARPGREADHSRLLSAEVSSGDISLPSPVRLHDVHRGDILLCPFYLVCEYDSFITVH